MFNWVTTIFKKENKALPKVYKVDATFNKLRKKALELSVKTGKTFRLSKGKLQVYKDRRWVTVSKKILKKI